MENKKSLESLLIDSKPIKCDICENKLFYVNSGVFKCEHCGHEVLDNFGKVKRFLYENGPQPMHMIAAKTGVSTEIISMFLKDGKVEMLEGSSYYMKCERCGCSIRYGRYCPGCIKEMAGGINKLLKEDMDKTSKQYSMSGKVRFVNKRP